MWWFIMRRKRWCERVHPPMDPNEWMMAAMAEASSMFPLSYLTKNMMIIQVPCCDLHLAAHYSIIILILYTYIVLWYYVEWLRNKVEKSMYNKIIISQVNEHNIYIPAQIQQSVPALVINVYVTSTLRLWSSILVIA